MTDRPEAMTTGDTFDELYALEGLGPPAALRDQVGVIVSALWERSTLRVGLPGGRDASAAVAAFARDLGGDPAAGAVEAFDNALFDHVMQTLDYAALVGYALGRTEGLPEPMRLGAARAFARHVERPAPDRPPGAEPEAGR